MRFALPTMILTLSLGSLSASPVELDINPTATVRGNVIRVSDVATVVSGSDTVGVLDVQLARTPAPGDQLRLTRARIRGALAAQGFDAQAVRVRGSRAAVITPAVTRLDPKALRSLATRFLRDELAERYQLAVPVRVAVPKKPWVVPVGRTRSALHVRWLVQPSPGAAPERAHVEVVVTLDGQERAVRTLVGRIELPEAPLSEVPPVAPPAAPIANTPAAPKELLVVAGQRVRTRVRVGALTVYSEGVAAADGALNARIAVQVATGPVREGRVVAPGVVEITGTGASQ